MIIKKAQCKEHYGKLIDTHIYFEQTGASEYKVYAYNNNPEGIRALEKTYNCYQKAKNRYDDLVQEFC